MMETTQSVKVYVGLQPEYPSFKRMSRIEELIYFLDNPFVNPLKFIKALSIDEQRKILLSEHNGAPVMFKVIESGQHGLLDYAIREIGYDVEKRGLAAGSDDDWLRYVTPLWLAAVRGQEGCVRVLLQHGADVTARSTTGTTPLCGMCYKPTEAKMPIARLLVDYGSAINCPNMFGGTPLINAITDCDLLRYLVSCGADIHQGDNEDFTPLHYAVREEHPDSIKLLLDLGANPYKKNRDGLDSFTFGICKNKFKGYEVLLEHAKPPAVYMETLHLLYSTYLILEKTNFDTGVMELLKFEKLYHRVEQAEDSLYDSLCCDDTHGVTFGRNAAAVRLGRAMLEITPQDDGAICELAVQAAALRGAILGQPSEDVAVGLEYSAIVYVDFSDDPLDLERVFAPCRRALRQYAALQHQFTAAGETVRLLEYLCYCLWYVRDSAASVPLQYAWELLSLLVEQVRSQRLYVHVRPQCSEQLAVYREVLQLILHLANLVLQEEPAASEQLVHTLRPLTDLAGVHDDRRRTLLHLACSDITVVSEEAMSSFPSLPVITCLTKCGFRCDVTDDEGRTPPQCLMTSVSSPLVTSDEYPSALDARAVVLSMVSRGAHVDARAATGEHMFDDLFRPDVWRHMTLKCHAARALHQHGVTVDMEDLPVPLYHFFMIH